MWHQPQKHFTWEGDVLKWKSKLVVGNDPELKTQILQKFHDSALKGNFGYDLTYKRMKDQFYWKTMQNEVKKWVQNCHFWQKNKPSLQLLIDILRPLPIPT